MNHTDTNDDDACNSWKPGRQLKQGLSPRRAIYMPIMAVMRSCKRVLLNMTVNTDTDKIPILKY